MDCQWFLDLLKDSTFWTAVGALSTLAASFAIFYAARQFRFEAWNKCQEVFTEKDFTNDRRAIFTHISDKVFTLNKSDLAAAMRMSGKMDELCHLARFFGKTDMIKVWGDPIGKAWALLHVIVQQERDRTAWQNKWKTFETIGSISVKKFPTEEQIQLLELGKQFGASAATAHNKRLTRSLPRQRKSLR